MSAALRALIGDLAVATVELAATPSPPSRVNHARFVALYTYGQRLFHLAVEVGIARALEPAPVDAGMLAPLVEAFEGTLLLEQLCSGLEDAFSGINQINGVTIGARSWDEICLYRSAIEVLRDLLQFSPSICEELDIGPADAKMRQWCRALYRPQTVAAGMPRSHWWWFGYDHGTV